MIEVVLYMYVCCYYVVFGGYEYSIPIVMPRKVRVLACPSSASLTLGSTSLIQFLLSMWLHTSVLIFYTNDQPSLEPNLLIYCPCNLQLMDKRECHISSPRQHLIHTCIFGPMLLATLPIFLILSMGAYSQSLPPEEWDHTVHGGKKDTGKCSTTCKLKSAGRS
jgi:hypothetical protein